MFKNLQVSSVGFFGISLFSHFNVKKMKKKMSCEVRLQKNDYYYFEEWKFTNIFCNFNIWQTET
jgi:hypothetical protein